LTVLFLPPIASMRTEVLPHHDDQDDEIALQRLADDGCTSLPTDEVPYVIQVRGQLEHVLPQDEERLHEEALARLENEGGQSS